MILDLVFHQRITEKKRRLDSLRPLPPALVSRLRDQAIVEWTYHSNAIEGTRLSLRETELILEHGLTIKGKTLKEHFEAVNHRDAILFLEALIKERRVTFNQLLIRQIHQLVLNKIDAANAGAYREVDVTITGSKFVPPNPAIVPVKMREFEQWLSNKTHQRSLIDFAAIAHFRLVDIHPFVDGNGRTARLLMNLILMNRGFPPTVILNTDRQRYYRTLDLAHRGDVKPFVDFIGRNVERSLSWYLDAVTPAREKTDTARWQLLSVLAPTTPYSQEYLSFLARAGRIEAIKKGRNWYSTLRAIEAYQNDSQRRK